MPHHVDYAASGLTEKQSFRRYNLVPFKGYCMEASKCPIGMLWFILSVPVYRIQPGRISDSEDLAGGQIRLPKKDIFPSHIRPPPLLSRNQ